MGQLTLSVFTLQYFKEKQKLYLLQKRRFPALVHFNKRSKRSKSHFGNDAKLDVYLYLNSGICYIKYPGKNLFENFTECP